MYPRKPFSRALQQQPVRHSDPAQQQAGSTDFQPRAGERALQMGLAFVSPQTQAGVTPPASR